MGSAKSSSSKGQAAVSATYEGEPLVEALGITERWLRLVNAIRPADYRVYRYWEGLAGEIFGTALYSLLVEMKPNMALEGITPAMKQGIGVALAGFFSEELRELNDMLAEKT